MIIICKECSTKFRLDESLLMETGSQVRCCACKNIFTAYPPQVLGITGPAQVSSAPQGYFDSEEELGPGGVGGFQKTSPEEDDDGLELDVEEEDEDIDADGIDLGDDDTGLDDGGINLDNNMPGMDTGITFDEDMEFDTDSDVSDADDMDLSTGINLNLDQGEDLELDTESDLKKDSTEPEIELPDLEPDPVAAESSSADDEDFEFEFELDEEGFEIEDDLKLDEPSADPDEVEQEEDLELSIYDEEDFDQKQEITASIEVKEDIVVPEEINEFEDDDEYESVELEIDDGTDVIEDDDFVEKEFEDDGDYEIEEFDEDDQEYEDDDIIDEEYEDGEVSDKKTKKSKKKSGKLLKVLVTILMLLGVGYGSFKLTDGFTKSFDLSKINFSVLKNLLNFSDMDEIPVWATIDNQSLNGRYVTNESSGQLFVITGKITNESKLPLNNIEIEGTLIAKGGVVAKKKKVFCGNKIPEGQLSTSSISAINTLLLRKDGEQGANLNIKANESVPFMVVFSNLPDELENYTVTVNSFKRMN